MANDGYLRIKEDSNDETVIERSKFLSYSKKIESEDDAKSFLTALKKQHPFATHHCYAYTLKKGDIARFSDDGEPQGTAGQPILECIKNKKLYDTVVVVVRYFGGIKLGAGGLVRAYSDSTAKVLALSGVEEVAYAKIYKVGVSYDLYSALLKFIENKKVKIIKTDYDSEISVDIAVDVREENFLSALNDYLCGKATYKLINEGYEVF